ncbi:hypothetical protein [Desulforamulus profundi]|nr:hypothetical protein [Desulforamulus profundi]
MPGECDLWGMPLLAMMYVRDGSKESEYDPVKIKHAARVAEEVGADIIKVYYTGSPATFAEITGSVKVPVVIAGGPKMDSTTDLLTMIADSLKAGGTGVSTGRNVFQDADPMRLSGAIRRLLDSDDPDRLLLEALTGKIKKAAKGDNPAEDIPKIVQEFVSHYMSNIPHKKK